MPVAPTSSTPPGANTNGKAATDSTVSPTAEKADPDKQLAIDIALWKENDYLCKNYILNRLTDPLYDYYRLCDTAKHLWEALQKKYDTEEAGVKKYAVSRYLNFKMSDDKSVEAQSHELQQIAHEIIAEGMELPEQFQIAVIIESCLLLGRTSRVFLDTKLRSSLLKV